MKVITSITSKTLRDIAAEQERAINMQGTNWQINEEDIGTGIQED